METQLVLEEPWYHYSRVFPSARAGWLAWQTLEEALSGKNLDLGIYRHGLGEIAPGKLVTVVSLHPQGVLRARQILRKHGGNDQTIPAEAIEALVLRRVRAVTELTAENPGQGGTGIYHHLGEGREINPDGTYS